MSRDDYIVRLRRVRDEYEIANAACGYILKNYNKGDIYPLFAAYSLPKIKETIGSIQFAYFVRLSAEFENILREHLIVYHSTVQFPHRKNDWKVD